MKRYISYILFYFFAIHLLYSADNDYWLKIKSDSKLKNFGIPSMKNFNSAQKRALFIEQTLNDLHQKMYLSASADSIWLVVNDTMYLQLFIGEKYHISVAMPEVVEKNKKSAKDITTENIEQTNMQLERRLLYLQENGYPFAEIYWDTLSFDSLSIKMNAHLEKGPLILYDSLKNRENGKISTSFLKSYLGIKKEMPYKESLLMESDQLLRKLPFVTYIRPPNINFRGDKATFNVYLAQKKVSKFDFLIGLLPNNNATGKVLITGEARLQLQNAFKRGEEIFLEWKRIQPSSQSLQLKFNYPYILNSPIGAAASFNLDKRDSTFLDVNWTLGIPFRTKANNYIKAYIENTQTIVLKTDTLAVKNRRALPTIQDVNTLLYGFEAYFENLDYLFNPRRGVEVSTSIQVGTRKIKPDGKIISMSEPFNTLYDTVKLKSLQILLRASMNAYVKLSARQVMKIGLKAASKINGGILDNEMFRIGGANLLRGFDEESIFTQHYAVMTAEYRFILQQNSYLYTFFDAGFVSRRFEDKMRSDYPFGFGAGIAFETKAGIFGVSYAVGRQQKNPIEFKNSKIHFGYVNIF
ncbi:MAG: BamA/TamA family outer membrane protein [Chitinophagales bacterium]|nr:BamA/TamA family outer membrane protein [Chitinophagales bacterium]